MSRTLVVEGNAGEERTEGDAFLLPGRPLSLRYPITAFYIYIYYTLRTANCEQRASSDMTITAGQSVSRGSTVKQSSRRRARSRTRRWSIVAVINKMINFNYEFIMFT